MSVFDDGADYVMVSNSGDKLPVSAKAAKMSVFAANQMEIIGDDDDREIKLPLVKTEHLRHIVDWCEHHADNKPTEFPSPLPTGPFENLATAWENDFLRRIECDAVPPTMMSDVANAANFMHIDPLINLICAKLALKVRPMTPDEIYDYFGVSAPTTQQLKDLEETYPWLKEEEDEEEDEAAGDVGGGAGEGVAGGVAGGVSGAGELSGGAEVSSSSSSSSSSSTS
mgnify:CR=1 FL=1